MKVTITADGQGLVITTTEAEALGIVEALAHMANRTALRDHQRQRARSLRAPLEQELERLQRLRSWESELAAAG